MLEVKGLHTGYGGMDVIHGIDISVGAGGATIASLSTASGDGLTRRRVDHATARVLRHEGYRRERHAVAAIRQRIGDDRPGVVVRLHHDQARAEDHEECEKIARPTIANHDAARGRCGKSGRLDSRVHRSSHN